MIRSYVYIILLLPFYLFFINIIHKLLGQVRINNSFVIAIFFVTLVFPFLIYHKRRNKNILLLKQNIQQIELVNYLFLILFQILASLFLMNFYDWLDLQTNGGDTQSHLSVIFDTINVRQEFFSYNYLVDGQVFQGLFYPTLAHYLPGLMTGIFDFNIFNSYVYAIILFCNILFPTYLFLLLRLFSNSSISLNLVLLSLFATISPFGLIQTGNFSMLFSIVILTLFVYLAFVIQISPFHMLSLSVILLFAHPSALFSLFLVVITLRFNASDIKSIFKSRFIFVSFIGFIVFVTNLDLQSLIKSYVGTLPNINPPSGVTFNDFVQKIYSVLDIYVIRLGDNEYYFPNLIFIIFLILFKFANKVPFIKFEKRLIILYIVSYLILFSSFLVSFNVQFNRFALLSFFYYQSPIRIAHLVVLSNLLLLSALLYSCSLKLKIIKILDTNSFKLTFVLTSISLYYANMS